MEVQNFCFNTVEEHIFQLKSKLRPGVREFKGKGQDRVALSTSTRPQCPKFLLVSPCVPVSSVSKFFSEPLYLLGCL